MSTPHVIGLVAPLQYVLNKTPADDFHPEQTTFEAVLVTHLVWLSNGEQQNSVDASCKQKEDEVDLAAQLIQSVEYDMKNYRSLGGAYESKGS